MVGRRGQPYRIMLPSGVRITVGITDRELDLLRLLATGTRPIEIAARLGLAPGTVRNELRFLYRRLAVRGQVEAVLCAIGNGIVPVPTGALSRGPSDETNLERRPK